MTMGPLLSASEHVTLVIDDVELEVVSLSGEEAVSRLFRYEVGCRIPAGAGPGLAGGEGALGRAAAVTLRDGFGGERTVHGVVAESALRSIDDGSAMLEVVIRPELFWLTLGRDSRVFSDLSVVDIVKRVLSRRTAPTRWEVARTYPRRDYCAQYREDDWTFVARHLEEEGIHFRFDHEGGRSTLVLSDTSGSAPELVGGAVVPFAYETNLAGGHETIEEIGQAIEAGATRFTVGSFDPAHPDLDVSATVGDGPIEHHDAPGGGPETPAVCAARAQTRLEAAVAARNGVSGGTSSVRLVPGRILEIQGHPVERLDGRYFITRVSLSITQRRRGPGGADVERAFQARFDAAPQRLPYRPPATAPVAKQAGLQSGVVVGAAGEEIFPDPSGRVRVQLHWDREGARDDAAGRWMRVAQRGTADSMLLPRVGWNLLTVNDEGSVDAPTVLSRIHDAEHPPTYALPANMTRVVFKTATTPGGGSFNEVYFEDRAGQEEMFMNASRDMSVLVKNVKQEMVARDSQRSVGNDHSIAISVDLDEHVVADQTVTIAANETISVGVDRTRQIEQNDTETIGGNRSIETGTSHTTTVARERALRVGSILMDTTLGQLSSKSRKSTHIMVGGARMLMSAKSIGESVKLLAAQTIGGAKVELAADGRSLEVKKIHVESVGGTMVKRTSGAFTESASVSSTYTAGGLIQATAPEILIEAKQKIRLVCGGTSITITTDTVEIVTPSLTLDGASKLVLVTPRVEHN